jgi:hypothetical protein
MEAKINELADVDTSRLMEEGQKDAAKLFSQTFDNLRSIADKLDISPTLQSCAEHAKTAATEVVNEICVNRMMQFRQNPDEDSRARLLVFLKEFALNAPSFAAKATKTINDSLSWAIREREGASILMCIGEALKKHERQDIANRLIEEHDAFKRMKGRKKNEKMLKFTANDVLTSLKLTSDTSDGRNTLSEDLLSRLRTHYESFDEEYWELVLAGLNTNKAGYNLDVELRQLKEQAFELAEKAKELAPDAEDHEPDDCPICLGPPADQVKAACCLQGFCKVCITTHIQHSPRCPTCRTPLQEGGFVEVVATPTSMTESYNTSTI